MFRRFSIASGLVAVGSIVAGCSGAEPGTATGTATQSAAEANAAKSGPKPPPEAFEACKDLTDDAACSVHLGDRDVSGKCRRGPDGTGELACAPPRPPPGARMGPPKEAVEACASLSTGADCHVAFGDGDHAGTCRNGPDGNGPLACAPSDMPPPPPP